MSERRAIAGTALFLSLICICVARKDEPQDSHNDAKIQGYSQVFGPDFNPPSSAKLAYVEEPSVVQKAPVSMFQGPNAGMQVLSWEHRVFYYPNFLTAEEADHLRALAEPEIHRSGVVDANTGEEKIDPVRTSSGMFLRRQHDDTVSAIEERIAEWTLLPVEYGEGLQVLRYENNQHYDAHWDYFFHDEGKANGGNRICTVLMYLEDTEEGGETTFPNIPAPGGVNEGYSDCAKSVLAAKPAKGAAVMFWSTKPTGELNKESLHEACPVLKGTKWSAAKWIHMAPYAMAGQKPVEFDEVVYKRKTPVRNVGDCIDMDGSCEYWSKVGECEKNADFMIGTALKPGRCLKSCSRCDVAQKEIEKRGRKDNPFSK